MGEVRVFELPLEAWVSGFVLITLLMLILYIIALVKIGRLRRRLNAFLNGSNVTGLEAVIGNLHAKTDKLESFSRNTEIAIKEIQKKTAAMKGNVAVIRYNAFAERGSDLSFSVAIIDDDSNGVVISSIHSRDESFVYGKPVNNGSSSYTLTPEEKDAIQLAIQKKN
ncbi:DUF4446 family protein [Paenibacillus alkalitolerans]|uniref:DUF4446 family protein n=1 Tax=Paenibacillus alkalitolerans TaxID=2799335 RepID=UPI0018F3EB33|nr:DUF4446 family protein [Paenibacillus alkalitolerans]